MRGVLYDAPGRLGSIGLGAEAHPSTSTIKVSIRRCGATVIRIISVLHNDYAVLLRPGPLPRRKDSVSWRGSKAEASDGSAPHRSDPHPRWRTVLTERYHQTNCYSRGLQSVHWTQVEIGGALADLSTVFGSLLDRLAEVKPDEDARMSVLDRRLREAGI